jgi:molybdopterin-dependent oxidoreductase alpha subunit
MPEDVTRPKDPKVGKPKRSAVGIPGIAHSLQYALTEMGPKRSLQTLLKMNHVDGFDCPSCAWPDPDRRKAAEFCANGAKAVAWEATRKRLTAEFFAAHSVADLRAQPDHWLEHNGRLTEPLYLAPDATHYRPISWDGAIALTAQRLRALPDPNRAVFYTSGRASNEAAFVYQLLARRLGTNNLPDCSNMCHESSGKALNQTIGIGKGTVTLDDIAQHAELIVIVGQNPGTNHPRMLTALEDAKKRRARIVAINPLHEAGLVKFRNPQTPRAPAGPGTKLADRHLPVRVNGDLALFAGVNRALLEREDSHPGVDPQAHRTRRAGLSRLRGARPVARRVHPAQRAARLTHLQHRDGTGAVHRQPAGRSRRARGSPATADSALTRPVQHHHLRPG